MKKRSSIVAAMAIAGALAIGPSLTAHAEVGAGSSTCNSSWSYTWANSTTSITHKHTDDGVWRQVTRVAGVSSYKGFYKPGWVTFDLIASGSFSGEVYGCAA